jgi:hypothetical protein
MRGAADNIYPFPDEPQSRLEEFRPTYVSQLEGYTPKPREWLVDGVLMRGTVCLFAGPSKIGKSMLAQHLLSSVAVGDPWLGRTTVQARTFGLFTEDPDEEVRRRQLAINAYYGRAAADFELEMSWEARETKDSMLCTFERFTDKIQFTPLWFQLWNYVHAEGVTVVCLDPASVVYGGNENFRGQVTAFMRALVKEAVKMNGVVLLLVHPPKAQQDSYSGSGAWLASSRFAMSFTRPPEYDAITDEPRDIRILRGLGANYGAGMRPERLQYRDGVFEVIDAPEKHERKPLTFQDRVELRYRLLAGCKKVLQNGGKIPADEMHRESMPSRARRSPDAQINHIPLNDLYVAQAELIDAGQLVRVDVGHRCLLRPADGPYYPAEMPWLPSMESR